MGVFENLPYTNFHETNLAWIVSEMKKLIAIYDKLPADLQKYVDEWLDAHPEATTTVQDGSITDAKLSDDVRQELKNWMSNIGSVNPIYIGDYIIDSTYMPSSHVIIDNILYTFNTADNTANTGQVKAFNLTTNRTEPSLNKTIVMGHANSAAYDPDTESVYIAPVFRYDQGSRQPDTRIFRYDKTLSTMTVINTNFNGSRAMGLSYDKSAKLLYLYCYNHEIYSYDGTAFTLVGTVDFSDVSINPLGPFNNEFNQDFAVDNGHFVISSPQGNLITGEITTGDIKITSCGNVNMTDRDYRWILGELEGMEFTNGHLYAVMYNRISGDNYNGFIVEIPTPYTINNITPQVSFSRANYTFTYVSNDIFNLDPVQIRSLQQLIIRIEKPASVNIPTGTWVDPVNDVAINDDVIININGSYSINRLYIFRGWVNIAMYGSGLLILRRSELPISCDRSGHLTFSGSVCNISTPNLGTNSGLIIIGTAWPHLTFRMAPTSVQGITYRIASNSGNLIKQGFFIGSTPIWTP